MDILEKLEEIKGRFEEVSKLIVQPETMSDMKVYARLNKEYKEPWYVDYSRSFFPVLLIVLVLRSFIAEPLSIFSLETSYCLNNINRYQYNYLKDMVCMFLLCPKWEQLESYKSEFKEMILQQQEKIKEEEKQNEPNSCFS